MSLGDYLPPGIGIEDLIVAMAGASALFTCLAVYTALLARTPVARRAQRLAEYRRELRESVLRRPGRKRLVPLRFMRQAVQRAGLLRGRQNEELATKLARAGWRSKDAVVRFLFFKLALPFTFGGGAVLMLYGFDTYQLAPLYKLGAALAAVLVGSYAPELFVKNREGKRANALRKSLPDGIDLMVICAEAGLSLDATFARVAGELGPAAPEFGDELEQTTLELGFLPDRAQALRNLVERSPVQGLGALVNTLIQAERYGAPLTQTLRVLSAEFRTERILKAEEKAARLPAMLTVPMIVFILPPLFVVLLGPAILDIMDSMQFWGTGH